MASHADQGTRGAATSPAASPPARETASLLPFSPSRSPSPRRPRSRRGSGSSIRSATSHELPSPSPSPAPGPGPALRLFAPADSRGAYALPSEGLCATDHRHGGEASDDSHRTLVDPAGAGAGDCTCNGGGGGDYAEFLYSPARGTSAAPPASSWSPYSTPRPKPTPLPPSLPLIPRFRGPQLRPFKHRLADPLLARQRLRHARAVAWAAAGAAAALASALAVCWGASWSAPGHAGNLRGVVVDLDGGRVGAAVARAFEAADANGGGGGGGGGGRGGGGEGRAGGWGTMGWRVAREGEFAGAEAVQSWVLEQKGWAAAVVHPGTSQGLAEAVAGARAEGWNASAAVTAFVTEARDENVYSSFIFPSITGTLQTAMSQFAEDNAALLAQNLTNEQAGELLSKAPGLVTAPLSYTIQDLRPFDVPVAAAAVDLIGLVYLLLVAFTLALTHYSARVTTGYANHLDLPSTVLLRTLVPLGAYVVLALVYSLVSLAFQVPFGRYFGRGGFVLFWCINFLGMSALGLTIEAAITFDTLRIAPCFVVLWIAVNVSVSYYPMELLPRLYHYGYLMPFYHVSSATRAIIFGTKNTLATNFLVQVAWIAASLVTIPLVTWISWGRNRTAWRVREAVEEAEARRAARGGGGGGGGGGYDDDDACGAFALRAQPRIINKL